MFVCYRCMRDRYGFWNFISDLFLLCITSGLWSIGICIREYRRAKRHQEMYWRGACCGF